MFFGKKKNRLCGYYYLTYLWIHVEIMRNAMSTCADCGIVRVHISLFFQCIRWCQKFHIGQTRIVCKKVSELILDTTLVSVGMKINLLTVQDRTQDTYFPLWCFNRFVDWSMSFTHQLIFLGFPVLTAILNLKISVNFELENVIHRAQFTAAQFIAHNSPGTIHCAQFNAYYSARKNKNSARWILYSARLMLNDC
jgi:hypothetical protein